MLSSNLLKTTFILAALLASSCGFWQTKNDAAPSPTPFVAAEIESEIPFSTKEPDVFQAEISVTTNGIEDVIFTARNGANRLTIYDFRKQSEFSLLNLGDNRTILINHRRRIYAESESAANVSDAKSDSLKEFLTAEWINEKKNAEFENLGAENNLTKYRVRLDESANSEMVVSVDEKINLPVKQEFYAISGEQRTLILTTELKNFSLQTEPKFYEVPKDYRKISVKEFQDTLRGEKLK